MNKLLRLLSFVSGGKVALGRTIVQLRKLLWQVSYFLHSLKHIMFWHSMVRQLRFRLLQMFGFKFQLYKVKNTSFKLRLHSDTLAVFPFVTSPLKFPSDKVFDKTVSPRQTHADKRLLPRLNLFQISLFRGVRIQPWIRGSGSTTDPKRSADPDPDPDPAI